MLFLSCLRFVGCKVNQDPKMQHQGGGSQLWKNLVGSLPLMLFLTVFALLLYHVIIVLHSIHLAYEPLLRGIELHLHQPRSHSEGSGASPGSMRSIGRVRRRCCSCLTKRISFWFMLYGRPHSTSKWIVTGLNATMWTLFTIAFLVDAIFGDTGNVYREFYMWALELPSIAMSLAMGTCFIISGVMLIRRLHELKKLLRTAAAMNPDVPTGGSCPDFVRMVTTDQNGDSFVEGRRSQTPGVSASASLDENRLTGLLEASDGMSIRGVSGVSEVSVGERPRKPCLDLSRASWPGCTSASQGSQVTNNDLPSSETSLQASNVGYGDPQRTTSGDIPHKEHERDLKRETYKEQEASSGAPMAASAPVTASGPLMRSVGSSQDDIPASAVTLGERPSTPARHTAPPAPRRSPALGLNRWNSANSWVSRDGEARESVSSYVFGGRSLLAASARTSTVTVKSASSVSATSVGGGPDEISNAIPSVETVLSGVRRMLLVVFSCVVAFLWRAGIITYVWVRCRFEWPGHLFLQYLLFSEVIPVAMLLILYLLPGVHAICAARRANNRLSVVESGIAPPSPGPMPASLRSYSREGSWLGGRGQTPGSPSRSPRFGDGLP